MTTDDVLDKALDIEALARDCYQQMADHHPREHVRMATAQLAREEQKHIDLLIRYRSTLERSEPIDLPPSSTFAPIWQEITAALEEIREAVKPHTDEITAVQRGITLEKQSLSAYEEAQRRASADSSAQIFEFLVQQDKRHLAYLEKLLDRLLIIYQEPAETRPQL